MRTVREDYEFQAEAYVGEIGRLKRELDEARDKAEGYRRQLGGLNAAHRRLKEHAKALEAENATLLGSAEALNQLMYEARGRIRRLEDDNEFLREALKECRA